MYSLNNTQVHSKHSKVYQYKLYLHFVGCVLKVMSHGYSNVLQ